MRAIHGLVFLLVLAGCGDDDRRPGVDGAVDLGAEDGSADASRDVALDALADVAMDAALDAGGGGPDVQGARSLRELSDRVGSTPVSAYVPDGNDRLPLVLFAPGFTLDSSFYAATLRHIASHGFIVVRADPPASFLDVNHPAMRDALIAALDWATGTAPFAARVDASRIATMGHSLGGKLATMVALADPRVSALLAIDPVDGGMGSASATPDIVPSAISSLSVPAAFFGETLNGSGGFMPCAPSADNFQQFFEGARASSAASEYTFVGADHMDFVADRAACGFSCTLCEEGSADPSSVLANTATLATAFLRQQLMNDGSMGEWLGGPRLPAGVRARFR